MKKPRVYIAGKVTGMLPKRCLIKFLQSAKFLRGYGFLPVNPIEVVNDFSMPWDQAMRLCLRELTKVDAVFLQPDWKDSTGAKHEAAVAHKINIPVFEDYEELAAHFGKLPIHRCKHPAYAHSRKVLSSNAGCEETVKYCRHCGKYLEEPVIDC